MNPFIDPANLIDVFDDQTGTYYVVKVTKAEYEAAKAAESDEPDGETMTRRAHKEQQGKGNPS